MKKIIALLLALMMLATALTACGDAKDKDSEKTDETTADTVEKDEIKDDESDKDETVAEGAFAEKFTVQKVSKENLKIETPLTASGGLYYSKDGKKGIMTFDGKNDSGAIWASVKECGKYFAVSKKNQGESLEIEDLNVSGVVDVEGNEILPCEYFIFTSLSERYIKTYKVTERTSDKDEAMLYIGSMLSLGPGEEDPMFKGLWQIYDVVKGAFVEGVEGTSKEYSGYTAKARGNYIVYYEGSKEIIVDANGSVVGDDITVFDDGSISKVVDNKGVVLSPDGEELFTYELNGYVPDTFFGGYYQANKRDADGKNDYVILDSSGEMVLDVSDERSSIPNAYGEIIEWNRTAYDLNGNVLLENVGSAVALVGSPRWAVLLKNEEKAVVAKYDGSVIATVEITDEIHLRNNATMYKQGEEERFYYSYADGDFTLAIDSYSEVSPWTVNSHVGNALYNLVDTYTGEVLLENYKEYRCSRYSSGVYYIYAKNVNEEWEIFEIK